MSAVEFMQVSKRYQRDFLAVDNFSLAIANGELLVLLGASGCGKSTLLRLLAGLENTDQGTITIGETIVNNLPPKNRDVAMIFQNYALYPHLTAGENMAFSLKMRGQRKNEITARVNEVAKILNVEKLLTRYPHQLSGGECQRVAIGRAIVREPAVFLFDEPLSNLDAPLRAELRQEISHLHQRLRTTLIYVTHDQSEALSLGERIAIMNHGALIQVGTPTEIFHQPRNLFVAQFIGTPPMNIFAGQLQQHGDKLFFIGEGIKLTLNEKRFAPLRQDKQRAVKIGLRSRALKLADNVGENTLKGTCDYCEMIGEEYLAHLTVNHQRYLITLPQPPTTPTITVIPDLNALHIFCAVSGENLLPAGKF